MKHYAYSIIDLFLTDCPTATCNPPSLSFPGGVVAIDASAVDIEASTNIIEDQKKEELLLEIHHLRERIKCLETDIYLNYYIS